MSGSREGSMGLPGSPGSAPAAMAAPRAASVLARKAATMEELAAGQHPTRHSLHTTVCGKCRLLIRRSAGGHTQPASHTPHRCPSSWPHPSSLSPVSQRPAYAPCSILQRHPPQLRHQQRQRRHDCPLQRHPGQDAPRRGRHALEVLSAGGVDGVRQPPRQAHEAAQLYRRFHR